MPVSSLVLSLQTTGSVKGVCSRLVSLVPGLELGVPNGVRVPAVLEAVDYTLHDSSLDILRGDPEVSLVDVVFHDFSDVSDFGAQPKPKRPRRK